MDLVCGTILWNLVELTGTGGGTRPVLGGNVSDPLGRNLTILLDRPPWTADSATFRPSQLAPHTVNDLLTMYVGTASQHALRMTFVHESKGKSTCYPPPFVFYLRVLAWDETNKTPRC